MLAIFEKHASYIFKVGNKKKKMLTRVRARLEPWSLSLKTSLHSGWHQVINQHLGFGSLNGYKSIQLDLIQCTCICVCWDRKRDYVQCPKETWLNSAPTHYQPSTFITKGNMVCVTQLFLDWSSAGLRESALLSQICTNALFAPPTKF